MVLSWDCYNQMCILKRLYQLQCGEQIEGIGISQEGSIIILVGVDSDLNYSNVRGKEDKGIELRVTQEEFVID